MEAPILSTDSVAEIICRAISHRKRLAFMCGDEMCVVEPHQLGRDAEGDLVLLAYLVEGEGEGAEGEPEGERWRVYRVADVYWALEGAEPFDGPRPGYEPASSDAVRVGMCQL